MEWVVIPLVTVLGMVGGQCWKPARRFFVPIISVALYCYKCNRDGTRVDHKKVVALLAEAVALSSGYGENSKYYKLCGGRWWLVRLIYGLMVGFPVALAGFVWGALIMPLAYMVRFNYSFKVGKYDFLWQDFYTYSLLGYCIWMVV